MWPPVFGVSGLVTFVDDPESGWVVLIDPPWKSHGMDVGCFDGFSQAVAYIFGPLRLQQPLPLEVS
jgi:hypothetical protein